MSFDPHKWLRDKLPRYMRYSAPLLFTVAGLWYLLQQQPPLFWSMLFPLVLGVCLATDLALLEQAQRKSSDLSYRLTLWVLPGLLVLGAALFIRFALPDRILLGVTLTPVLLLIVIYSQHRTLELQEQPAVVPHLLLSIITYVVAFGLYAALFDSPADGLLRAVGIGVVCMFLTLEIFRSGQHPPRETWLQAGVIGLVLGQIALALDYWALSSLVGGIFLLLVFYAVTGIGQNYLARKLTPMTVIEFVVTLTLGLIILFGSRLWLPGAA